MSDAIIHSFNERISETLDMKTNLGLIGKSDTAALAMLDSLCFGNDLGWDQEEYRAELGMPGANGLIIYYASYDSTLNYAFGSILWHDEIIHHRNKDNSMTVAEPGIYISSVAVAPSFRRKYVFSELYACFEQLNPKADSFSLHTRTSDNLLNNGAYLAFQKIGFSIRETIHNYYGKNDDAYKMVKRDAR